MPIITPTPQRRKTLNPETTAFISIETWILKSPLIAATTDPATKAENKQCTLPPVRYGENPSEDGTVKYVLSK
jgi:hypothetical protein